MFRPYAASTVAWVARTASADFANAAFSSAVSVTSKICSRPVRPSLQGTPQKTSLSPYSPVSHAEHGSTRFRSRAIASTISTAAALGA